jgi:hypothetical protein
MSSGVAWEIFQGGFSDHTQLILQRWVFLLIATVAGQLCLARQPLLLALPLVVALAGLAWWSHATGPAAWQALCLVALAGAIVSQPLRLHPTRSPLTTRPLRAWSLNVLAWNERGILPTLLSASTMALIVGWITAWIPTMPGKAILPACVLGSSILGLVVHSQIRQVEDWLELRREIIATLPVSAITRNLALVIWPVIVHSIALSAFMFSALQVGCPSVTVVAMPGFIIGLVATGLIIQIRYPHQSLLLFIILSVICIRITTYVG